MDDLKQSDSNETTLKQRQNNLELSSAPLLQTEIQFQHQHQHQHEVTLDVQLERSDQADASESDGSELLDKAAFIEFCKKADHIDPAAREEKKAGVIWDNLLGNVRPDSKTGHSDAGNNPIANRISKNAAELILHPNNFDKFCAGIDFYHLPPGLKLQGKALYFSPLLAAEELPEPHLHIRLRDKDSKEEKKNNTQTEQPEFSLYVTRKMKPEVIQTWWKELYNSHIKHCTRDEPSDLIAYFKNFLAYMHKADLELPAKPPQGIQSLPVTLGRIVSLIEHCAPVDRQTQLDLVPDLNFKSTGAIRALDLKKSNPSHCRFVHPAMGYQEDQFDFQDNNGYTSVPITQKNENKTYTKDLYTHIAVTGENLKPEARKASIRKAFWRFVGHHDAFPLSFYVDAEKEIQKHKDPELHGILYCLLAGVSTGTALLYQKLNKPAAAAWWKELSEVLALFLGKFPGFIPQKFPIDAFCDYKLLPPVPLLRKINRMLADAIRPCSSILTMALSEAMERENSGAKGINAVGDFQGIIWLVARLSTPTKDSGHSWHGPQAVYEGMRFCYQPNMSTGDHKAKKNENENFLPTLITYTEKLRAITDAQQRRYLPPNYEEHSFRDFQFMLRSFDAFQLSATEIPPIYKYLDALYPPSKSYGRTNYPNDWEFSEQGEKNYQEKLDLWSWDPSGQDQMKKDRETKKLASEKEKKEKAQFYVDRIALKINTFQLLEQIDNNAGLSKDSLLNILEQVNLIAHGSRHPTIQDKTVAIIDYLKAHYERNFPSNFLQNQKRIYLAKELSDHIVHQIDEHFKDKDQADLVKQLLKLHNTPDEAPQQEEAIGLLSQLSSLYGYDSASFHEWLHQILEYEKKQPHAHKLSDLNSVFLFIVTEHNPLLLETLLYRENRDDIPHLLQTCSFLQERTFPWLKEHSNRFSQESTYPALVEVTVPADPTKLEDSLDDNVCLNIKTEADSWVDQLDRLLEAKEPNPENLNHLIEQLLGKRTYQTEMALWEAWEFFKRDNSLELESTPKSPIAKKTPEPTEEIKKEKKINVDALPSTGSGVINTVTQTMGAALQSAKGFFQRFGFGKKADTPPAEVKKLHNPPRPSSTSHDQKESKSDPKQPPKDEISLLKNLKELLKSKPQEILKEQVAQKTKAEIYGQLKQFVHTEKTRRKSYQRFFLDYYEQIYRLIEHHSHTKKELLNYISHFAKKWDPAAQAQTTNHLAYVKALHQQITCLKKASEILDGPELKQLLYHYQKEKVSPLGLIDVLAQIEQVKNEHNRKALYKLFAKFSGETILASDPFEKLCKLADTQPSVFAAIDGCYKNPPYLPLTEVLSWAKKKEGATTEIKEHKQDAAALIQTEYHKKDIEPFTRDPKNIFDPEKAKEQARLFLKNADQTVEALAKQITQFQSMSTSDKIEELTKLKEYIQKSQSDEKEQKRSAADPDLTIIKLTALLGELLYATANQELNYTQYLTLYSSLSAQGSTTHQVVTGGGKSRITMGLCAGLHILGKTVDFVTKNEALVDEIFHENRHFFQACGIPRQIIDVNTSTAEYLNNNRGINFSSKYQLALFHNKVCTERDIFAPEKDQRVLVADEADLLYYESGREHVVFSTPLQDKNLGNLSWIYPWVMQFTARREFRDEYLDKDTDRVFISFRDWIKRSLPEEQQKVIDHLKNSQLEVWFKSALIANYKMQEGVTFDGEEGRDRLKWTPRGLRLVSSAIVKSGNSLDWHSTYSDGVHQLLNVRLNNERNKDRKEYRPISKTPYEVEEESYAIFRSTMSTLLNRYGTVLGFTGTAGSYDKRQELSKYKMTFVEVPRHHPNKRIDLPIQLAASPEHQRELLYRDLQEAVQEDRPVLIICENDVESRQVRDYCRSQGYSNEKLQLVDSTSDMKEATRKAAQKGMVTITTDIMGRGTDIKQAHKEKGLRALVSYLPEEDDLAQILGRVARNDDPGDARLILDIQRLKSQLKIPTEATLTDAALIDLFLNREAFIRNHQTHLDWAKQDIRTIYQRANALGDQLTQHFFNTLSSSNGDKDKILQEWVRFNKSLKDEVATPRLSTISQLLESRSENYREDVIKELQTFVQETVTRYGVFFNKAFGSPVENLNQFNLKPEEETSLKRQLNAPRIDLPFQSKTYQDWDPAHSGQNVVYHKPFAHTRAVLQGKASWTDLFGRTDHSRARERGIGLASPEYTAWSQNKRLFFANTRAYLAGDLNTLRDQLNNDIKNLYATLLAHPGYKDSVQTLLGEIEKLSVGADKDRLGLLIRTLKATREFIENPNEKGAPYQILRANIRDGRYKQGATTAITTVLTLGVTLASTDVFIATLTSTMPQVLPLDFSLIPANAALGLSAAGEGIGLLLIGYMLKTLMATSTKGLESAMTHLEESQPPEVKA